MCGLTQKEFHLSLNDLHDPSDPEQCCLRGPKYIQDKNIRERVLQYNLKHPISKHITNTTITPASHTRPPSEPNLQFNKKVNFSTPPSPSEDLPEPTVKSTTSTIPSLPTTNQNHIQSLIDYIEKNHPPVEPNIPSPKIATLSHSAPSVLSPTVRTINTIHEQDHQVEPDQTCIEGQAHPAIFYQHQK